MSNKRRLSDEQKADLKERFGFIAPEIITQDTYIPNVQDAEVVSMLRTHRYDADAIAYILGITTDELHQYYEPEYTSGVAQLNAAVARTLYHKAISGDTPAAIFWLKAQAGWSEGVPPVDKTVKRRAVDAPPPETREEWVKRISAKFSNKESK